jgi:putative ABC transport system permease protein
MVKSYLLISLRTVRRQPVSTLINVVGLGAAMTLSLLVLLLVSDQRSYDRFNTKHDRIVRVLTTQPDQGALAATPAYLGPALEEDVPEVDETVRFAQIRSDASANDKALYVTGLHVEPSFFSIFDFQMVSGDPATALAGPHRIILTDETAHKFFGDANPMGQPFTLANFGSYTVAGVLRTEDVKSHLRFDVLASFETVATTETGREELQDANNFWRYATYVLLSPGASPDVLAPHLARYAERYQGRSGMEVQPLTEIMLGPPLSNEIAAYNLPGFVVWALFGLGIAVIVVAVFNYVGLAVAQASRRAREVGIRKAIGAHPTQLRAQFMIESVFTAFGALIVGTAMLSLLVPAFNQLSILAEMEIEIAPSDVYTPNVLGTFFVFTLIVGLLAGLYPAFELSRFRPAMVLRGGVGGGGRSVSRLRRILTVVQLAFSLFFVVTTVVLIRQFGYMNEGHFGFHVDDQITVALQGNDARVLRDELLRIPDVVEVGSTSRLPAADGGTASRVAHGTDTLGSNYFSASAGFIRNLDLVFLAGQNFEEDEGSRPGVVLNETAVERFGFATPEAALAAPIWFNGMHHPVIGVVRDFQVDAMATSPEPLVIVNDPTLFVTATIRVVPGNEEEVLAALKTTWARLDARHTLEYDFYAYRARNNDFVRTFQDLTKIIAWLAFLALLIACLGLLSVVAYVAARRVKEIGIRKVLGAGTSQVVWLLSREFLVLSVIAALVALPLAYFANRQWLDSFHDHVPFGAGILLTGLVIVLMLVLAIVFSLTTRAALADPVKNLRYE